MRERIIGIIACSVIFITVLIIAVTTAARGSVRTPRLPGTGEAVTSQPKTETSAENNDLSDEPPPVQYRYKRANHHSAPLPDFIAGNNRGLNQNLRQYQFKAGILIDLNSRKILWEKNSTAPVPIASLTKLLTIYTAFEELERRSEIALNSPVTVSQECTLAAPVRINLKPGEKVTLHELFIYAMLRSANDAAHLIAEYFGYGDSRRFVRLMNTKASEIGMTSAKFYNANGLPIYGSTPQTTFMNVASCQDMARLIERIYDYPMILRYTSCKEKNTRHGNLVNGNRLLGSVRGMQGMKTGYTNAAGHCLAFSCSRNGRRLIGVVTGFSKRQNCFDFTAKLLEWGFAQ